MDIKIDAIITIEAIIIKADGTRIPLGIIATNQERSED